MDLAQLLFTLGLLFLAGLAADQIGRFVHVPRVTMLLVLGLIAGDAGFGLIPKPVVDWFEGLSIVALTMVAFLLGGALTRKNLASHGREILWISIAITVCTVLIVTAGLILAGTDPGLALLLGAIATATAPAAMTDVIRQSGINNSFTEKLKGIVAIDDVWGLIVFSVALAFISQSEDLTNVLAGSVRDLAGGVSVGVAVGVPAAYLTGRLLPGEPQQTEAIGIVFLTAGLAIWFEVSFLISGMTAGAIIVNFARHHERAFHEIEHIQWPFMILFFFLAGATLELDVLRTLGWTGGLYMLLRLASRLLGGWLGASFVGSRRQEAKWIGPALLPQAGVAVGMALVAGESVPQWSEVIMALTIASTVVFEVIGPPISLAAIRRTTQDIDEETS